MKQEPYCIDLKFKNHSISNIEHHSHLYIKENEIYIKIYVENEQSDIDNRFMTDANPLGFFEENFEIINSEFQLKFDKSRIYSINSISHKIKPYFTIYLTSICIIKPNIHHENTNLGKVLLNKNGLTVVNSFYSFFSNFNDKNKFEISKMNTMKDHYDFLDLKYKPELDFIGNDKRGSKKFTVLKRPTISFEYKNSTYEDCINNIEIICKFLSFYFGVRVEFNKLVYRTQESIFIYYNNEKDRNKYVSKLSVINRFLEKNYSVEKILKTEWHLEYLKKKTKFDRAIDNLLHSREVENSSKYLLLFNIIEIFNINQNIEKFEVNSLKDVNLRKAQELFEKTLTNSEDIKLFRKKWEGIINKVYIKPLKSPLEETLKSNNINTEDFGYTFNELKSVRDKLTHGSTNSINEEKLKNYITVMRKICICLILFQLGFGDEIKKW